MYKDNSRSELTELGNTFFYYRSMSHIKFKAPKLVVIRPLLVVVKIYLTSTFIFMCIHVTVWRLSISMFIGYLGVINNKIIPTSPLWSCWTSPFVFAIFLLIGSYWYPSNSGDHIFDTESFYIFIPDQWRKSWWGGGRPPPPPPPTFTENWRIFGNFDLKEG
jgi:hypothetical protein